MLVGKRGNPIKAMSNRAGKNERVARNRSARHIVCGNVSYGIGPTWKYAQPSAESATLKLGRKKYRSRLMRLFASVPVTDSRTHRKKWRMRAERPTAG